jgi:very-short-patch-repair endonuclease
MNKKYWTKEEINILINLFIHEGILRKDIAFNMKRSEASIAKKIKSLNLKRPAEIKTKIWKESHMGRKNGMYGKVGSNLGKKFTELHKSKISKTRKRLFKEGKLDISGKKNGMYGKNSWNAGLSKYTDKRLKKLGEKSSITKKEQWKNMNQKEKGKKLQQIAAARRKCKTRIKTKIEKFIEDILIENNILFEQEYPIGVYIVDFFIPSKNLVIECMGDYWHANPKFYIKEHYSITQKNNVKRDKRKNKYLNSQNINLVYYWEYDIKKFPREIKKKLLDLISKIIFV